MEFDLQVRDGQIVLSEEINALLKEARELDRREKENKFKMEQFKMALLIAMEKNGIKKWDNDIMTVSYVAPTTRKSVDVQKLKDNGIYEEYVSETVTNSSIRVKFKEEKKDKVEMIKPKPEGTPDLNVSDADLAFLGGK